MWLKIFGKKIVLLLQAITSGGLYKGSVLLKKLSVRYEIEAKSLTLNKLKTDTRHECLMW